MCLTYAVSVGVPFVALHTLTLLDWLFTLVCVQFLCAYSILTSTFL
jgi:hypothetical protein